MAFQRNSNILSDLLFNKWPIQQNTKIQKRTYVVKPNVEKVELNLKHPIGRVGYLFTKSGVHLREIQSEYALKDLASNMRPIMSSFTEEEFAAKLKALLNLETTVKFIEKPDLLRSDKVHAEALRQGTIRAVAWVKGLDVVSEAVQAASKPDAHTLALIKQKVSLQHVLSTSSSMGLRLPLEITASVQEWWTAYTAANVLQVEGRLFSNLTGLKLDESQERKLRDAAHRSIVLRVTEHNRQLMEGKPDLFPSGLKYLTSDPFQPLLYTSQEVVEKVIRDQCEAIRAIQKLPINKWTIHDIVSSLMSARNALREICFALESESTARQGKALNAAAIAGWDVINQAHLKQSGEDVKRVIRELEFVDVEGSAELIQTVLPAEAAQLQSALGLISNIVESIPGELLGEEFARRHLELQHCPVPASYDRDTMVGAD